jgi:serine/threonine protein phosphatase 1
MPLPTQFQKVQRYPVNTQGKDYVVGDIHGMYETLLTVLTELKFDGRVDRLFSVGDLVDRGPDSQKCAELIYESWFYAVRGNHEQMMIDALVKDDQNSAALWAWNGGQWGIYGTPDEQNGRRLLAADLDLLPLVIVVGEGDHRFNVVHAEMIHREYGENDGYYGVIPLTDAMIDNWVFNSSEENGLIWGRQMISGDPVSNRAHNMVNMSLTFVGHTPVREPIRVQRQIYLDGGAVFAQRSPSHENSMIIACPHDNELHVFRVVPRTLETIKFTDITVGT